jgi:maltose alpha-D-glucosyltransferase/alpha-amylase
MCGMADREVKLQDDPLWYKDAIIYEVHVRAFYDSNRDGIGDFQGLAEKLDYLADLGVTAIWILPFCPSPWRDDGYDISDYSGVHPAYGTLRDFQHFLREAHRRGLRVITELVLNHTSDQHVWFQRARQSPPGSRWRNFYVWSDSPDKYKEARIIFKDTETSNWTWDSVAKAYYWHRFFSHQPDLNYANPRVQRTMFGVVDFWLGMGVDGLRLDAVPYLYEREGTTCENLPETHAYLRELRRHVDSKYANRMLLAEANQWPEDAIAYFGEGDESHMNFHFPLMPRLFMAIRMEDRFPLLDILEQTPAIPENCQWALFLRNHDELTLEMVTDEERDYMYRVYATDPQMRLNLGIRRRLAPLLGNDRRTIELMNGLLLSLPGTPVIYYGDEIGMGDNFYLGDRNGVRTPMQWSPDRNAGFSSANPQRLYLPVNIDPEYHYEAVNVEAQQQNPHSLLWWMKRTIAQRKELKAFGRGSIQFLQPENRKVLAFLREYGDETILVVANLSRFAQAAELDLSAYKGMAPVEVFGKSEFAPIGDAPYLITLGPHSFYWLAIEPQRAAVDLAEGGLGIEKVPVLAVSSWDEWLTAELRASLERLMPAFLRTRRWFAGRGRRTRKVRIAEALPMPQARSYLMMVDVEYGEGDPERYLLPLALAASEEAGQPAAEAASATLARLRGPDGQEGLLYGALWNREFQRGLLDAITRRRRFRGEQGELISAPTSTLRRLMPPAGMGELPATLKGDHTHTSIIYGDKFRLKLFRKLEPGINPELEVGFYLSEKLRFPHVTPIAGALEYRQDGRSFTAGILHAYVESQGDGWRFTLDSLGRYFETALTKQQQAQPAPQLARFTGGMLDQDPPPLARELIGTYLETAKLIGQRTAELHLALGSSCDDPSFAPEPFTDFYRQSLYHYELGFASQVLPLLRQRASKLGEAAAADARKVLQLEPEIRKRFEVIRDPRVSTMRIRVHGDLHLGEILITGKDLVFIDFEGDPSRPLSERKIKRSPLRDVACMLRSFHYAAQAALLGEVPGIIPQREDRGGLDQWARYWQRWVIVTFLKQYLATAGQAAFLPKTRDGFLLLLAVFALEKALDEVQYELNNRPDWVRIPLRGILQMFEQQV